MQQVVEMWMKPLGVLALVLVLGTQAAAQPAAAGVRYTDSLKSALKLTRQEGERAAILASLAEAYLERGQLDSTIKAAKAGAEQSKKARADAASTRNLIALTRALVLNDQTDEAERPSRDAIIRARTASEPGLLAAAFLNRGDYYQSRQFTRLALVNYDSTLRVALAVPAPDLAARAYARRAQIASSRKQYKEALRDYLRSVHQAELARQPALQGRSLIQLGDLYQTLHQEEKAFDAFERAARTLDSCRCDIYEQIKVLTKIANLRLQTGDTTQARQAVYRALKLARTSRREPELAFAFHGMGEFFVNTGRFDSAEHYLRRAETLALKHRNFDGLYSLVMSDRINLCIRQGKYDEAQKLAQQAEKAALLTDQRDFALTATRQLFETELAKGNYQAALRIQEREFQIKDSLKEEENRRKFNDYVDRMTRARERDRMEREREQHRAEIGQRNLVLGFVLLALALLGLLAWNLFRGRQREKHANTQLRQLFEQVQNQKAEIEAQNAEIRAMNGALQGTLDELQAQREALETQHLKIADSISYASRIQRAILPNEKLRTTHLPPHFIYYRPRDVVSGDFYWMTRLEGRTVLAAVDCTGHGVPGAFMSVLGSNLLHQIVDENGIHRPEAILATLDRRISRILQQQYENSGDEEAHDGMDVALVVLHDPQADGSRRVEFAGAGRPLWHLSGGRIIEYKSARFPCGGSQHENKVFPTRQLTVWPGESLYLFSDGVPDQFGGSDGRKLGSLRLQQLLIAGASQPAAEQEEAFARFFSAWVGSRRQIDDVLLVGLRVE